jgi:hypothetical protein
VHVARPFEHASPGTTCAAQIMPARAARSCRPHAERALEHDLQLHSAS